VRPPAPDHRSSIFAETPPDDAFMGQSSPPRRLSCLQSNKLKPTEIASRRSFLGRWVGVDRHTGTKIWTDGYSNLLSIIQWH
jgi:hypothetical protein